MFSLAGKRVYVGLRAGSTFQALDLWRKLVGDDAAIGADIARDDRHGVERPLLDAADRAGLRERIADIPASGEHQSSAGQQTRAAHRM